MKGRQIKYSAAELAWLSDNRLLPISDYTAQFCETFSRADVNKMHLNALRKRKGWKTGRTGCFVKGQEPVNKGVPCAPGRGGRHPNARKTQFRKGNKPHNTNYLHHERVSKDGYVEISIDETNPHTGFDRRYVLKHRWQWERKHGPLAKGMALKCLDGDTTNTDPSNWQAVPRALLPRLNGGRHKKRIAYDDAPAELKPTLMAVAKLEQGIHERRKAPAVSRNSIQGAE